MAIAVGSGLKAYVARSEVLRAIGRTRIEVVLFAHLEFDEILGQAAWALTRTRDKTMADQNSQRPPCHSASYWCQ